MKPDQYIILDFDSTFVKVETLDVLAEIALADNPDAAQIKTKIKEITDKAMSGDYDFGQALAERLATLPLTRAHIDAAATQLSDLVSPSFKRNLAFFKAYAKQIIIVSSGFKEAIAPVVKKYGIGYDQIYANTFAYDAQGHVIGYDKANPLSAHKGKIAVAKTLPAGDYAIIGDGYTDYEITEALPHATFYAFAENVERPKVVSVAHKVLHSFDEFLYDHNLPMALSYPKSRIKVLVLEGIHTDAVKLFEHEGYQVEYSKGALDETELCEQIKDVSVLCIRSKTKVTRKVLDHATKLLSVSAFCIGTNQIDLEACNEKGVAVFNAPFSNTRSVVELAISMFISLYRNIPKRDRAMHRGEWRKSASNSNEVRGKTLGIVGYGNIGSQLSVLAENLGMRVIFYDLLDRLELSNANSVDSLEALLKQADFVSLHVDGRPENNNMFGKKEFALMKPGSVFVNLARGKLVDLEALKDALTSGHLRGAAVDVFPKEPKTNDEPFESVLRGIDNCILTPHIGGSTQEAQKDIGNFVPSKIMDYINTGSTFLSVNIPNLQLPHQKDAHRFIHLHSNEPGVLANINKILADHQVNILGQYLKTNEQVGYVITDVSREHNQEVEKALKSIKGTIRFRVLY